MSAEHIALANTDYVKLRLGVLNGRGEQKGVDSLIVTDLIELARNKSICDAILLSGDEDVRIGVQIAQNFGVCVHLIGIHPARGSQSNLLRQESDTTTEWDKDVLARFMTVSAPAERTPRSPTPPSAAPAAAVVTGSGSVERTTSQDWSKIEAVIDEIVMGLDTSDLTELEAYWKTGAQGVPSDVDRPLLAKSRDAVGRVLSPEERRKARHLFASRAKDLIEKAS